MIFAVTSTWAEEWQVGIGVTSTAISALSAFFSALFLWYTIKTFREIRRQTELQVEAFLVVLAALAPKPKEPAALHASIVGLHSKWRGILEKNLPVATQGVDRYLILTLKNRGRSDIVSWQIKLTIAIEPGPVLSRDNIVGEKVEWLVESDGSQHIIAPSGEIEVAVAQVGIFPISNISWSITYVDSRKTTSTYFAGDSKKRDLNAFASTSQPTP